eukprot:2579237-Lingulodinium_polyedra.AAC.2
MPCCTRAGARLRAGCAGTIQARGDPAIAARPSRVLPTRTRQARLKGRAQQWQAPRGGSRRPASRCQYLRACMA